ncbi:TPA: ERF family protein [Burkholderia contaminans]|uniref:ERF family protein n=1 Tax=Burkholderia contaminans TaxID=488447 RepID=UPI000CFF7253|nr:ERF family protein [Burkholderia contaminans]HDR9065520.1 ERF family protein [Burkholderia vietnamiensis]MBM6427959.1 ERF family protein [Burkholderia contaminans]MCA7876790.1 ERF family protein [Burkholderia contaminans]MDN8024187.1 ERF family protein [Burkholderia contaminans]PRG12189.1 single-stranded DNA-binding protein [Burkholderia contaminans]
MKHVHSAIKQVAKAISVDGIAKTGQNAQDGYAFRTIDDILDKLSTLLAEHDLIILPNVIERESVERRTSNGLALFFSTVRVRYDFTSARDDSVASVEVYGEAMDTADKATNKAMTAAYKVAVTQAFCIATKNNPDADATSHNAAARMPNDERTRHERAILAAPDSKALTSAHKLATAAAVRCADEEARKVFNTAKKTRTEQLAEAKKALTSTETKNTEAAA